MGQNIAKLIFDAALAALTADGHINATRWKLLSSLT
jgi:hypothetical protein